MGKCRLFHRFGGNHIHTGSGHVGQHHLSKLHGSRNAYVFQRLDTGQKLWLGHIRGGFDTYHRLRSAADGYCGGENPGGSR